MKTRITTTAMQPHGRLAITVEYALASITWGTQAGAAAAYIAAAGHPAAWRPIFRSDTVSVLCMAVFVTGGTVIWLLTQWSEQAQFHNRTQQRSLRRVGLACHLAVVAMAALAVSASPDRAGWWAALALMCFSAVATWVSWMEVKFLPAEDQAVIDAILAREAAARAAVHDASEQQNRRVRLTAIVETLGYTLADPPMETPPPADEPAIKWTIPTGKHKPLVYFIRNGNRMKIGTTTELKRRIRTLALRAENVALLVDGDHRREREYHRQFAEHRVGRTEWFAYEGALTDFVTEQIARVHREGSGK